MEIFMLLIFFKSNFFKKKNQEYQPSEGQTDWIQTWVQTVCKSYQQTTLGDRDNFMP